MTAQTVQFVHIVSSIPGTILDLSRGRIQFSTTRRAIEVVSMVHFTSEAQRSVVDDTMALVADVLSRAHVFFLLVTIVAKSTVLVANESRIRQWDIAPLAGETIRMPVGRHRLDHPTDDKVVALVTARGKQDVKILLAIFAPFEFVEDAILKLAEALGTDKTLGVPKLAIRVYDSLMRFEALVAPSTNHCTERHVR